ncbi:MAG TPA: hypothetical protein VKZ59_08970 [Acidobacteriota bacterium]|nr:hypothetical protein [Acidobacteriota bacterium]
MKNHWSRHRLFVGLAFIVLLASCQKRNVPVQVPDAPREPLLNLAEPHLRDRNFTELRRLASQCLTNTELEEDHDEALYLLVLVHSTPESPHFDLDRAGEYTQRLESTYPSSPYTLPTRLMYDLGRQLQDQQSLVQEVQELSRQLRGSRTELLLSIRTLKERIETLRSEKVMLENHLDLREQEIEALSRELAAARARSKELAEELEVLKEIDLKRNRPR